MAGFLRSEAKQSQNKRSAFAKQNVSLKTSQIVGINLSKFALILIKNRRHLVAKFRLNCFTNLLPLSLRDFAKAKSWQSSKQRSCFQSKFLSDFTENFLHKSRSINQNIKRYSPTHKNANLRHFRAFVCKWDYDDTNKSDYYLQQFIFA